MTNLTQGSTYAPFLSLVEASDPELGRSILCIDLIIVYVGELIFDILVFGMTLYKTLTLPRGAGIGLLSRIIRDGTDKLIPATDIAHTCSFRHDVFWVSLGSGTCQPAFCKCNHPFGSIMVVMNVSNIICLMVRSTFGSFSLFDIVT